MRSFQYASLRERQTRGRRVRERPEPREGSRWRRSSPARAPAQGPRGRRRPLFKLGGREPARAAEEAEVCGEEDERRGRGEERGGEGGGGRGRGGGQRGDAGGRGGAGVTEDESERWRPRVRIRGGDNELSYITGRIPVLQQELMEDCGQPPFGGRLSRGVAIQLTGGGRRRVRKEE